MDLLSHLRLFHPVDKESYALLMRDVQYKTARKGDMLVTPGQVQRELYFVQHGVQMAYTETEQRTHVIAFTYSPGLCAVPGSFSLQRPSPCYLQCLTDSELGYLGYQQLQALLDERRELERLFRKMAEALLAGVIDRHIELRSLTMEERFVAFCRRSPHLLHTVPHKYIASYLGIDATNFSKLFNKVKF